MHQQTASSSTHDGNLSQTKGLFSRTLALQPGTAQALLPALVEAARIHLGMEIGFISRFEGKRRHFQFIQQPGERQVLTLGASDPLEESFCQRVVDGRLPRVLKNAQNHPEALKLPVTRELGIGAHVSVPIVLSDGTVFGTFCCFSFKPDETLNDRDQGFLSVLADLAASVLDQELTVKNLQDEKRNKIKEVITSGALVAVWQPIVDVEAGRIIGAEALARFNHIPPRPPNVWFDEAAEVGLTAVLERNALIKGLEVLEHLPGEVYVACNISAEAFFTDEVREVLDQTDVSRIVLEITEHDIVADYERLATALVELRERGARVAVDDFGAGYASFRHILKLNPDLIKLDMSLVRNVDQEDSKRALMEALIQFARSNRNSLVAEGVETESELNTLRSLGIRNIQGFLFHRPMPRDKLLEVCAAS